MEALLVSIEDSMADAEVARMQNEMTAAGVAVEIERREGGPQASVWLYALTAVAILFTKPFLEGFAKKAGEDCYSLFKGSLARAVRSICARKVYVIGKQPDVLAKRYSLCIAFYYRVDNKLRVKFLIRNDVSDVQYDQCISRMCDLLREHAEACERSSLITMLAAAGPRGPVLLDFNFEENRWGLLEVPLPPLADVKHVDPRVESRRGKR